MFDFGGVYFTEGYPLYVKQFHKKYGIPKEKLEYCFSVSGPLGDYSAGKIDKKKFWKRATEYLNIDKKIVKSMEPLRWTSFKPIKGMKRLVAKLRKKYKIILVSGNEVDRVKFLNKKYKFLKNFDQHFFTYEYRTNKPDAKLCEIAIWTMKVKPTECVMVDDVSSYLENCRKLGVHTILFRNPEQFKKSLKKLGVSI